MPYSEERSESVGTDWEQDRVYLPQVLAGECLKYAL